MRHVSRLALRDSCRVPQESCLVPQEACSECKIRVSCHMKHDSCLLVHDSCRFLQDSCCAPRESCLRSVLPATAPTSGQAPGTPPPAPSKAQGPPPAAQVDMSLDLKDAEQDILKQVKFSSRKSRGATPYFVFQWTDDFAQTKKWSSFYPSKETASRAIWSWAGESWRTKIVRTTEREEPQEGDTLLAPRPQEVDVGPPLTPAERELLSYVYFARKGARQGTTKKEEKDKPKEFWVFFYKAPWGPQTKQSASYWYPSKEMACRAILTWAQDEWYERVKTIQAFVEPSLLELKEDRVTQSIRQVRQIWFNQLVKKCTPEFAEQMRQDETSFLLSGLFEDDAFSESFQLSLEEKPRTHCSTCCIRRSSVSGMNGRG